MLVLTVYVFLLLGSSPFFISSLCWNCIFFLVLLIFCWNCIFFINMAELYIFDDYIFFFH